MMKLKKWHIILILIIICLSGCVSQIVSLDDHREGGIGKSIQRKREIAAMPESYESMIGWKETTYKLDNGNWVYVEPGPRHYIHWEVNPQGIIIGSRVEKTSNPPGHQKPP